MEVEVEDGTGEERETLSAGGERGTHAVEVAEEGPELQASPQHLVGELLQHARHPLLLLVAERRFVLHAGGVEWSGAKR